MWRYASRSTREFHRLRCFSSQGTAKATDVPSIAQVWSRHSWQKQRPKLTVEASSTKKADEKPWPNSVIYGAAGAAAIIIPYTIAWITVTVPALRQRILTKNQIDSLRRYFGTEEPCFVPYTDLLNKDGVTDPLRIPYVLPGERSPHKEAAQASIEEFLKGTVLVDVTVADAHDQSTSSLVLPASEIASSESLLKHCEGVLTSKMGFVAVDFPEADGDSPSQGEVGDSDELIDATKPVVDPLLEVIPIYSTWYFQPPLQNLDRSANHVTAKYSNEELQMRQLESDIARLEVELRDLRSTRAFDDIQEELNMCRSQLRRLKWKRWMPW